MKKIIILACIMQISTIFSQNHTALIGTWEATINNQIFRVELFKGHYPESDDRDSSITGGNFSLIENINGIETTILTSYKLFNPNDPNDTRHFPAAIRGGSYTNSTENYHFILVDHTSDGIPTVDLRLRFVEGSNTIIGNTPQLKWMISSPFYNASSINVPIFTILTKVD